jgi:hypothetical protein
MEFIGFKYWIYLKSCCDKSGDLDCFSVDVMSVFTAKEGSRGSDVLRLADFVDSQLLLDDFFVLQDWSCELGSDHARGNAVHSDAMLQQRFGHCFGKAENSSLSD